MSNVEYIPMDQGGLDHIGPLWEKLREHHRSRSKEFGELFTRFTFAERKAGLLRTAASGKMRVDIVRDTDAGRYVGYCISSLSPEKKGEIESIYVEPEYRGQGIGDNLMCRALRFMDEHGALRRLLAVAAGNEEVFGFYRRHGFVPRYTMLEQVADPS